MASYFYRVYVPKFSKSAESFSTYDKSAELRLQSYFIASLMIGTICLAVHVYALVRCVSNPRHSICFTNLYTWAGYMFTYGFALFVGMILHYGYIDPSLPEPDFHDVEEPIYENEDDDIL
jgi:hypothetical protein